MQVQIYLEDFGFWDSIKNHPIGNAIRRHFSKMGVDCTVWVYDSYISIMIDETFTYVDITDEMREIARKDECGIFEIELYSEIAHAI